MSSGSEREERERAAVVHGRLQGGGRCSLPVERLDGRQGGAGSHLTETVVRRWVAQAEVDSGRGTGLTTGGRAELAQLRKDNRLLRGERDLLKRAMAFFAFMS
jgi:transposase-like protein